MMRLSCLILFLLSLFTASFSAYAKGGLGTPGSVSASKSVNWNTIQWNTVCNATSYIVEFQDRNITSFTQIYSGPGNDPQHGPYTNTDACSGTGSVKSINHTPPNNGGLTSGIYDYRVKACNYFSSGCGGWSAVATVNVSGPKPPLDAKENAPAPASTSLPSISSLSYKVGSVPAQFHVDETGSATYSIPIQVPTGQGGVKPDLSLNYHSNAGLGTAGLGWNLSGLSGISRCSASLADDGFVKAVDLSLDDKLCLDGRKLILIYGVYGQAGAEYRVKMNDKLRVRAINSSVSANSSFTVEHVDGSTHHYERAIVGNASVVPTAWLRNRIVDNVDNTITYNFNETGRVGTLSAQEQLLTSVVYGSGTRVELFYENDSSVGFEGYRYGSDIGQQGRLEKVVTKNHHAEVLHSYQLEYRGSGVNGSSLLDSVSLCADANGNTCLPATTFDYHDDTTALHYDVEATNDISSAASASVTYLLGMQQLDFNGDGKQDIVVAFRDGDSARIRFLFYENLDGESFSAHWESSHVVGVDSNNDRIYSWYALDFTLDGKSDVIYKSTNGWKVLSFNPSFSDAVITGQTVATGAHARFMDVDSDGDFDMLTTTAGANPQLIIYETDADSITNQYVPMSFSRSAAVTISYGQYNYLNGSLAFINPNTINYDFNADGLPDVFLNLTREVGDRQYERSAAVFVLEKNGTSYRYRNYSSLPVGEYDDARFGDINGDGYTDIIAKVTENAAYTCYFGTGIGIAANDCLLQFSGDDSYKQVQLLDYNSDGKADFVYYKDGRWRVKRSNGMTFGPQAYMRSSASIASRALDDFDQAMFMDINGDGHVGLIRLDFANKKIITTLGGPLQGNVFTHKMKSLVDGMLNETLIHYRPMSDDSVYSPSASHTTANSIDTENNLSNETFPVLAMRGAAPLVSEVISIVPTDNPDISNEDNELSVKYFYEELLFQAAGRGSLGFRSLKTYSDEKGLGVTTRTTYLQKYPYTGMPQETMQYIGGLDDESAAPVMSKANNSYTLKAIHGSKITVPVLHVAVDKNYAITSGNFASILTSTTTSTNTHTVYTTGNAQYLNLTNSVVATVSASNNDVKTVTTSNQYQAENATDWWLGRVTDVTTVTAQQTSGVTSTRSAHFDYYQTGTYAGMLEREVLMPTGSQEKKLSTLHCYNSVGLTYKTIAYSNHYSPTCSSTPINPNSELFGVYREKSIQYTDNYHRVASTSDAKFTQSNTISFNKFGQPTEVENIDAVETSLVGMVTRKAYDAFGGKFASANNIGHLTHTQKRLYSDRLADTPNIIAPYFYVNKVSSNGKPDSYVYFDTLGREVATVIKGFGASEYIHQYTRYDKNSLVTASSLPIIVNNASTSPALSTIKWTRNDYDDLGRLTLTTSPDGSSASTEYSGFTVIKTVVNDTNGQSALVQSETEVRNGFGQLTSVIDNANGQIFYEYDVNGNMNKVTNVDGSISTMVYDELGRKTTTNDSNKGAWTYRYNALGELVRQWTSRDFYTDSYRDNIGRILLSKTYKVGVGLEEEIGFTYQSHRLVKECFIEGGVCATDRPIMNYVYDKYGRQYRLNRTIDSVNYSQYTTYDEYGRPFQKFDGSGTYNGTRHYYNASGYMYQIAEAATSNDANYSRIYYRINQLDEFGNAVNISQNGKLNSNAFKTTTVKAYDNETGFVESILVSLNAFNVNVQDLTYEFDSAGNLLSRSRADVSNNFVYKHEKFQYDGLNRFTHLSLNNGSFASLISYHANGNIQWKSGLGTYCYDATKVNAVVGVGSECNSSATRYAYDSSGNNTSGRGRTIEYAHYDKPTRITSSSGVTEFEYDTNRSRVKRVSTIGQDEVTTYYVGNLEVINKNGQYQKTIRNLPDAIETLSRTNGNSLHFMHKDHLGSVASITDENGAVVEKSGFTALGKRYSIDRAQWNVSGSMSGTLIPIAELTNRGFTGHEHIAHADIIHMNGRIYDPTLGRFLQADPHIQAPTNSQNYNRYSYVLNNPLSYTDPSGYFFNKLGKRLFRGAIRFHAKIFGPELTNAIGSFVFGKLGGPLGVGYWTYNFTRAMGGTSSGALRGAFTAAASAFALQRIGGSKYWGQAGSPQNIIANAMVGGIAAELQGGKFGHGFLSAGFASAFKPMVNQIGGDSANYMPVRVIAAAVIGGTASKLSGGKFANGATTGAFVQLFNGETALAAERRAQKANGGAYGKLVRFFKNNSEENQLIEDLFFADDSPLTIEGLLKNGNYKFGVDQTGDVYGKYSASSGIYSISGNIDKDGRLFNVSVSAGVALKLSNVELGLKVDLGKVAPFAARQFSEFIAQNSGLSGQAYRLLQNRNQLIDAAVEDATR